MKPVIRDRGCSKSRTQNDDCYKYMIDVLMNALDKITFNEFSVRDDTRSLTTQLSQRLIAGFQKGQNE